MKLLCIAVFVMTTSMVLGQKNAVTDSTSEHDDISVFQLSTTYGNTANYYGQSTAKKLPYTSVDLAYTAKSGLWGSVSAKKMVNVSSGSTELSTSFGYDHSISRKLDGSISYTRFFFPKSSPLPQSVNPNVLSGAFAYDFKLFSSSLSGDYVFGNLEDETGIPMNDFYLTGVVSRSFDLGSLFSKKDYLTVSPSVCFTSGTQLIAEEQEVEKFREKKIKDKPGAQKAKGGKKFLDSEGKPVKEAYKKIKGGRSIGNTTEYVYSTQFGMISSSLSIPVAYNRSFYTIEASYQLSIPGRSFEGINHRNQSFFYLSFTYLFYKDK